MILLSGLRSIYQLSYPDSIYKGMLLDQMEIWERILGMAKASGNTDIQAEVEKQIAKTNAKLKF